MKNNLKHTSIIRNTCGFTLIELLVTVAIVGFIMSAVYAVQLANMRAIDLEADQVELQQDQRISVDFLVRELRMAGYNPAEVVANAPGIVDARSNFLSFTVDRNGDEDLVDDVTPANEEANEHISFCVYNSNAFGGNVLGYTVSSGASVYGGINDANDPVANNHTHTGGIAHQALGLLSDFDLDAESSLEFLYHYDDPGLDTTTPDPLTLQDIRGVTISLVTRADARDIRFTDTQTFTTAFNVDLDYPADGIRRRSIISSVRLRNMGL